MHLRDPEERIDHSVEAVEKFVEVAVARGVDEIGFTEHFYYFEQTRQLWDQQYMLDRCVWDLDRYVGAVVEAKERGLPVKLGLEVDYVAGRERETADLLAPYPWDYLLGSVHYVDGFGVDQMPGLVEKLGPHEAWRRYFVWLRNAARSGLFDSLSHPDLVKHHGPRPDPETTAWLHEDTADPIEAACVSLDVSAAGRRDRLAPRPRGPLGRRRDRARVDRRAAGCGRARRHRLAVSTRRAEMGRRFVARSASARRRSGPRGGVGARQRGLRTDRRGAAD